MKSDPSHEEACRRFSYDPATGILTHAETTTNRVRVGSQVGYLCPRTGYLITRFQERLTRVHRLIWFIQTGEWPKEFLDHKDGNRANNAWDNLRECSKDQNAHNSGHRNPRSGFKGVTQRGGSFMAKIRTKGTVHYLGSFPTAEEAAMVYDAAATRLHGEFSKTNANLGLV